MSGHKLNVSAWAQSCLGTVVSGHNRAWAQSCLGTIVSGHNRVWAQSFLGTVVWAQSCGPNHVWAQTWWNRLKRTIYSNTTKFKDQTTARYGQGKGLQKSFRGTSANFSILLSVSGIH